MPQDRRRVFQSIRELLLADNPKALSDVKKLVEVRFEGLWRKRQGDYRIFFTIDVSETIYQGFTYKGVVTIRAVLHRSKAY
jgi:mRNA-degrading endonuclease RelE of RelBE toxin-antitoxin system